MRGVGGIFRLQRGEPDASALSAALQALSFLKMAKGSHKKIVTSRGNKLQKCVS